MINYIIEIKVYSIAQSSISFHLHIYDLLPSNGEGVVDSWIGDCLSDGLLTPETIRGEVGRSWTKSVVGTRRPTFNFLLILFTIFPCD